MRNGEIETVQEASGAGAGLRVFVKGRMAFSSSNDLGEKALDDAVARAVDFARITTADEANVLPEDKGLTEVSGLYDPSIAGIPMDDKIELARKVEKLALKDPRVTKSAGAGYGEGEGEIVHRQLSRPHQERPVLVLLVRRFRRRGKGRSEILGR